MKTESQVRHKLRQVIFRHRKKYVHARMAQRPENCDHNSVVRLPLFVSDRAYLRVCSYSGEGWEGRVCDPDLGGLRQVTECPHYACGRDPDALRLEFQAELGLDQRPLPLAWIAREYPDIAALLWVLGAELEADGNLPKIFSEEVDDE